MVDPKNSTAVPVKSIALITDGPNEVVAKKFKRWEAMHHRKNCSALTRQERDLEKQDIALRKAELARDRKYFVRAFQELCNEFFHAPVKDLKELDQEALRVLEKQLVKKARPWAWAQLSGFVLWPSLPIYSFFFGIPGSGIVEAFVGVFGLAPSLLGSLLWLLFFFHSHAIKNNFYCSKSYLIVRRTLKKLYGEDKLIEILQKSL